MSRNNIIIGALLFLVIALCVGQGMLFQRLHRLQDQLSDIKGEPRSSRTTADAHPRSSADPVSHSTNKPLRPELKKHKTEDPLAGIDPNANVTAGQVENIVAKMLKNQKKNNPFAEILNFEMKDPLEVMKEELALTSAQIMHIEEYRKNRDAAYEALQKSELQKSDPETWGKQWKATQDEYESMVKNELTYEQKDKYDKLKKSGKLHDWYRGGVDNTVHVRSAFVIGEKKDDE